MQIFTWLEEAVLQLGDEHGKATVLSWASTGRFWAWLAHTPFAQLPESWLWLSDGFNVHRHFATMQPIFDSWLHKTFLLVQQKVDVHMPTCCHRTLDIQYFLVLCFHSLIKFSIVEHTVYIICNFPITYFIGYIHSQIISNFLTRFTIELSELHLKFKSHRVIMMSQVMWSKFDAPPPEL